uniref:PepX_C domain-containing protein n=1 Tax=Macrostomum lignano TaxID=282301 RepID=A0A1I8F3W2_9PLAT
MADGELLRTSCGSPNYAPPVISGKLYVDRKWTFASGGRVDFVRPLLCGSLPFDDEARATLFSKISLRPVPGAAYVSSWGHELLRMTLRVDPLKRASIEDIPGAHPGSRRLRVICSRRTWRHDWLHRQVHRGRSRRQVRRLRERSCTSLLSGDPPTSSG